MPYSIHSLAVDVMRNPQAKAVVDHYLPGLLDTPFIALSLLTMRTSQRASVEGRAWIIGLSTHMLHPGDPFPQGHTVEDVWNSSNP